MIWVSACFFMAQSFSLLVFQTKEVGIIYVDFSQSLNIAKSPVA